MGRETMKINKRSPWTAAEIERYLADSIIPMRIATVTNDFPTLLSIWYVYDAEQELLLGACHETSRLAKDLLKNNKCSFEIAPNKPPYKGVRGHATVEFSREGTGDILSKLIERYLGSVESGLASWLLSRVEQEYILKISPTWITAWDYSGRMD